MTALRGREASSRRTRRQAASSTNASRGVWALLFDRRFGSLFWGKLFSSIGVWMQSIVAAIMVYDRTGSATAVSLVSVAQFAPQLVVTPLAGSWADRGGSLVRQMALGRSLCAAGSLMMAVYFWRGDEFVPITVAVFVGSLTVGIGFAVGGPAQQSIVPDLVSGVELRVAMTLNTAPMTVARIVGPVAGAWCLASLGPAATCAMCSVTQLVFMLFLAIAAMPRRDVAFVELAQGASHRGVRHLMTDRRLVALLGATVAVGIGAEPALTLAPALAADLGAGPTLVGHINLCFGVGALVGLLGAVCARRWVGAVGMGVLGLTFLALGGALTAVSMTWMVLGGFALAGMGFSCGMSSFSGLVQVAVDPKFRGRVMAWWLVAFVGSRPAASLGMGLLADATSARVAAVVVASVVLTSCAWVVWVLSRHPDRSPSVPSN